MPRINLLPWREANRKERQRDFMATLALSLIVAAASVGYVHYYIEDRIAFQELRNKKLNEEIAELNKRIAEVKNLKKDLASLRARMDIVQRLQTSRPEIVHLFDEIPRLLPDGVFLSNLKQKERAVALEGSAQSNARVSTLMRNISASKWLTDPGLDVIQTAQQGHDRISKFSLHARQINPADNKEGGK
ncbi:Type IV pilus inner membrane component PilN [Gammaproteobacteria bacterium]